MYDPSINSRSCKNYQGYYEFLVFFRFRNEDFQIGLRNIRSGCQMFQKHNEKITIISINKLKNMRIEMKRTFLKLF